MSETVTLSLKTLLAPSKTVEVEYPGMPGFKITVAFLSRDTLIGIRKNSTKVSFKNRQASEEMDDKKFLQLYVEASIKGWTGLKLKYVEELAPIELGTNSPDALPEFSNDNALFLMQNSTNFDAFISETVTDLGNFSQASSK